MKRILRHGIFQGASFLITVTVLSVWIGGTDFVTALSIGVVGGLIAGIVNSLLLYKYAVPKYILDAVSVDIDADEEIRFQTPASYTSEQETVSGKLFLTNKRVVFKNYKQEERLPEFSIDLLDIDKVSSFTTLKFFENGLWIHTSTKLTHKFVVDRTRQWLVLFDRHKEAIQ